MLLFRSLVTIEEVATVVVAVVIGDDDDDDDNDDLSLLLTPLSSSWWFLWFSSSYGLAAASFRSINPLVTIIRLHSSSSDIYIDLSLKETIKNKDKILNSSNKKKKIDVD